MVAVDVSQFEGVPNAVLLHMQGDGCFYCGKSLKITVKRRSMANLATRDHLQPKSKGGRLLFNKVMACRACNYNKGARKPTELEKEKARNLYANCGLPRFGVI